MKNKKIAKQHPAGLLSHRSYTGKRLPRQHTAYPILLFLLLCLGVFMAGLTFKTSAADISVNAVSNGPPPPAPAIITSPSENTHYSSVPITVSGTCPARFQVKLYRNDVFSGSVLCALDNTFKLQTDLFVGANALKARIFNAVGDEGPASPAIDVYYDPPALVPSAPSVSQPGEPTAPAIAPFLIKADNAYKGYFTGDEIDWPLEILGGTAPYAINVDWGDGSTSLLSRKDSGNFSIHHVYTKASKEEQDTYAIKIKASDANDNKTFLQLMVIIHEKYVSTASSGTTSTIPPIHLSFELLWPIYGVTVLMALSFWLGSRREYLRLRPHIHAHR